MPRRVSANRRGNQMVDAESSPRALDVVKLRGSRNLLVLRVLYLVDKKEFSVNKIQLLYPLAAEKRGRFYFDHSFILFYDRGAFIRAGAFIKIKTVIL